MVGRKYATATPACRGELVEGRETALTAFKGIVPSPCILFSSAMRPSVGRTASFAVKQLLPLFPETKKGAVWLLSFEMFLIF